MSETKSGVSATFYPVEVRRQVGDRAMRVSWNDEHISDYSWTYLRGWCPCATCQGHSGDKRYIHTDDPQLATIAIVGKYALSLTWGDGHDTGIYSYRYLRELCPCPDCTASQPE